MQQQNPDSPCPVCLQPARITPFEKSDSIHCPRCQTYSIEILALSRLRAQQASPKQRAVMSGWIAENSPIRLELTDVQRLIALPAPTLVARTERLMRTLVRYTEVPGQSPTLPTPPEPFLIAAACAQDKQELDFYMFHLRERGLVKIAPLLVTVAGVEFVENLERRGRDSDVGFCAMWFNDEVAPLWTNAIEPAIREAGFEPKRIDTVEHNNRIDEEILAWIRRSRFLVADLTRHRQGVYFEAGFAMGLGLPVVWLVREDDAGATHFDNRQYNRIGWTKDTLGEAKRRLLNRIVATIGEGPLVRRA
jgi:hypothetical protein